MAKIIDKTTTNTTLPETLKHGEAFLYKGTLYMVCGDFGKFYVSLHDGKRLYIDDFVQPVDITITVEDKNES